MSIEAIAPTVFSRAIAAMNTSCIPGKKLQCQERVRIAERSFRVLLEEHTALLRRHALVIKGPFQRKIPFPEHQPDGTIRIKWLREQQTGLAIAERFVEHRSTFPWDLVFEDPIEKELADVLWRYVNEKWAFMQQRRNPAERTEEKLTKRRSLQPVVSGKHY